MDAPTLFDDLEDVPAYQLGRSFVPEDEGGTGPRLPASPLVAPAAPPPLTVLATCHWQVHWGGLLYGQSGGIEGQLTKCRLPDGLVFYVRENGARDHFTTSGGERMAMKRGEKTSAVDVLELCCPAARWDEVAGLVVRMDTKGRRVRRNRQFTVTWAETQLKLGDGRRY